MRIALISDTHQSQNYLRKISDHLTQLQPDLVIHLGDDYCDGESIAKTGIKLIQIPGTWCPQYDNDMIDNRRLESIHGWTLFLTHTPTPHYKDLKDDINPLEILEKEGCDLFLHGHTHKPDISQKGSVTVLNPGHCKEHDNRGFPPTFGILTLSENTCNCDILSLEDLSLYVSKKITKP